MKADHGGALPPKNALVTIIDEHFNEATVEVDKAGLGATLLTAAGVRGGTLLLQQLKPGGLRRVGQDQALELQHGSTFFILPGEGTLGFTVDRDPYEWPVAQVTAALILTLAGKKHDGVDLVAQTAGAPDIVFEVDDAVTLTGEDQAFVTKPAKKTVTVYYGPDETPFELERRVYKTEELLQKFEVEAGYVLDVILHNQFTALKPGEDVRVKEGMKFTSHPPVGQSS